MVFKPIHLARSVISKTFPNGAAQSLVAASQTSSASHNTHFSTLGTGVAGYFGKAGPAGHSQPSQHAPSHSATGNNNRPDTTGNATERGLDAYYAAWQKHHRGAEEKEWHQFQFAKRIGWKAPTTIPEGQAQTKSVVPVRPAHRRQTSRVAIHRTQSDSALSELKPATQDDSIDILPAEAAQDVKVAPKAASPLATASDVDTAAQSLAPAASDVSASTPSGEVSSPAPSTEATSVSDVDPYTNELASLAEQHRHAEVPAVFEAMLRAGFKPTSSAYNALLLAAIHVPRGKHQVIPKVLDVYSDMVRRQVAPDTATYAILIEVLAARALDVSSMKSELLQKQSRYGFQSGFLFASDELELKTLVEDESLGLAIKLFDTSAALTTNHAFPAETYSALISACAEQAQVDDMVRIYAEMESQQVSPPTGIFPPMIRAFAQRGDLRSSVECYEEYKALAIAHDQGLKSIIRRDDDVYASMVKAYALCDQTSGGLKFLGKIEENLQSADQLSAIRDAVTLQALLPNWSAQQAYDKALSHIMTAVSTGAVAEALAAVCIDAADRNNTVAAAEALSLLQTRFQTSAFLAGATASVLAAHVRNKDQESANKVWRSLLQSAPTPDLIEPMAMYTISQLGASQPVNLAEVRYVFSKIRTATEHNHARAELVDRIQEVIELISRKCLEVTQTPSPILSLELLQAMADNNAVSNTFAEHLIVAIGPNEISSLPSTAVCDLLRVQASLLLDRPHLDVGHFARIAHLVEVVGSRSIKLEGRTRSIVERALNSIGRSDLINKLQSGQQPAGTQFMSPAPFSPIYSPSVSIATPMLEDTYDPYAASTDFKGSNIIAEELEKTYGRHAAHLNEAMTKFRNMRRAGRHPRYATYGKLITAAAKENRLSMTQDILAMAKHDVPFLPHSRVVTQGWVTILDAMVSACLTMGRREMAAQYHNELLSMGFAPSANTFGLYITTLKESTKTFDEATEAVKVFHRAKRENVEPTSFLYNALIGKLGKARRIDDCLFYFAEMRQLGIQPTSVTYGTIVNALCRVSDDKFAEELFEEMESMPNYKPRPAPYNSLMQFFLTTKRDRSKVLSYYERMRSSNIEPTMHTYKLLIDTHATLEPVDMRAAEFVLAEIKLKGMQPEAVHYAALIHAKGCVLHDLPAARATFHQVMAEGFVQPSACLYQAIFESMVANHDIAGTDQLLAQMSQQNVGLTPYIANTLIHGWALVKDIGKARSVYDSLGMEKREPSTYEAMTRAYLAVEDRGNAKAVVGEALRRGYPAAVAGKICDLVGGV